MNQRDLNNRGPVLVTGASGFIGSAVVRSLVTQGHTVRALIRSTSPRKELERLGVEMVVGDIVDRQSVARALQGMTHLIHVAADYRLWVPAPAEMMHTNVEGTRIVMEEALHAGIDRIVYTSSVATLALREDGKPADETEGLTPGQAVGAYKQSKVAAERVVELMVAEKGLPAVIVHPTAPLGPGDVKPTPTGRMVVRAAAGGMPAFVDTGLNLVHVDDVAAGHVAALRGGQIGERYILGGENVPLSTILTEIAREAGRTPPLVRLPIPVVFPIAYCAEIYGRAIGQTPVFNRDELRMARHKMFFTSDKARGELDYRPRPYQEAIRDAVSWFRAHGYVR
jgi:dihydroflavonol-4-reductase